MAITCKLFSFWHSLLSSHFCISNSHSHLPDSCIRMEITEITWQWNVMLNASHGDGYKMSEEPTDIAKILWDYQGNLAIRHLWCISSNKNESTSNFCYCSNFADTDWEFTLLPVNWLAVYSFHCSSADTTLHVKTGVCLFLHAYPSTAVITTR